MTAMPMAATAALLAIALASPADASPPTATKTKLVRCGAESCLRVSGRRADKATPIHINGRQVTVTGGRRWHVQLSLADLRAWSPAYARTLVVSTGSAEQLARLPIGLLGQRTDLAMLVVRVR